MKIAPEEPLKMHFIISPQAFDDKTPSLRLRLRVAELRSSNILLRICSVFIAWLFLVCSVSVPQGINAVDSYRGSHVLIVKENGRKFSDYLGHIAIFSHYVNLNICREVA